VEKLCTVHTLCLVTKKKKCAKMNEYNEEKGGVLICMWILL